MRLIWELQQQGEKRRNMRAFIFTPGPTSGCEALINEVFGSGPMICLQGQQISLLDALKYH